MATELDIRFEPSTIENIDFAVFRYVESLNLSSYGNKGWKPVPVIWVGAERSFQIKDDKELRDKNGLLILPQITVERISMDKKLDSKGIFWGDVPEVNDVKGGAVTLTRRIQQDKTAGFANAKAQRTTKRTINWKTQKENEQVVYEIISTPIPVYLDMMYKITIRTDYQSQMNEVIQPFITKTGAIHYFTIEHNGHRYEAWYQPSKNLANNISNFDSSERIFKTELEIKVLGYLIGGGQNDERPKRIVRENPVAFAFKENIIKPGSSLEEELSKKERYPEVIIYPSSSV